MIYGDKSYLKASLTRGILEMQNRLIKLNIVNLQAIGTQSAFIAGFSFLGILPIVMPKTGSDWFGLHFLYDFLVHLTFCLAIFALSHSTIVTMYAPATALKGAEYETVNNVSQLIQKQKYIVLQLCVMSLITLFFASILNYWAKLTWPVAFITTIINLSGLSFILIEGLRVYNIFHPDHEVYLSDILRKFIQKIRNKSSRNRKRSESNENNHENNSTKINYTQIPTSLTEKNLESVNEKRKGSEVSDIVEQERYIETRKVSNGDDQIVKKSIHITEEYLQNQKLTQTRARGMIWVRSLISTGGDGKLYYRYAVIEKGLLNFYESENSFESNEPPVNKHPYQISSYRLETDSSLFPKGITSGIKSIRKRVLGQGEFSLIQLMSSEYDLKTAINMFRFVLLSEAVSELVHIDPIELMANDESQYNLWVSAISNIIKGYKYLNYINQSDEENTLSGNASLENVVKAANI